MVEMNDLTGKVVEAVNLNSSVFEGLPPEVMSGIERLITILSVTGVVIIGYILFLVVSWFFSIRRHNRINRIYRKVNSIEKKLDLLMEKEEVEKKIEEEVKKKEKSKKLEKFFRWLFGKKGKSSKKGGKKGSSKKSGKKGSKSEKKKNKK